LNAILMSII